MPNCRAFFAGLALLASAVGCRDSTRPETHFTLNLSVDALSVPTTTDTPDGPQIKCSFGLTAQATGTGSARWGDVRTLWYFGPDRTVALDTTSNLAAEVQGAFGAVLISGGETRHTQWYLYAGAPFEATLVFNYTMVSGESSTASVHIACGPTPQGSTAPVITQLKFLSPLGALRIGDTITVTYHETSSVGLWESIVELTGAFADKRVLSEHLVFEADHSLRFGVPNGADIHIGVPLTISVRAIDAALYGTAKSLETQLKYVDVWPPTFIWAYINDAPGAPSAGLAGDYAVGQTITLHVKASDDDALGWAVYTLGPPANVRDSVAAIPGALAQEWSIDITVRPEWVGRPQLSVYVRDVNGLTSQTVVSTPDNLHFYPLSTDHVTPALSLSAQDSPDDMVYDTKRDLMYVGLTDRNQVLVLSPSTMTLGAPITLPAPAGGMDLSPSGDSLLVAMPSAKSIAVIDLTHPAATPTALELTVLDTAGALYTGAPPQPEGLRVAGNGTMIVLLSSPTLGGDEAISVDLRTGVQRIRADARALTVTFPVWTRVMGRSNNRKYIYVVGSCPTRYDSSTDTFAGCVRSIGMAQSGMSFDAADDRFTDGNLVLDPDLNVLFAAQMMSLESPKLAISPDGATLYLGTSKGITTMRYADKLMLERIPVSADRLFVAPSGKFLLAFKDAHVTRIDLP